MFYSQFILAKKGPLGTIWIAAHLERKLRKNQVADTDIGVSVDSILFPEVPIALRLSSHLLLGVVRIYSRKVNYLFDDCSDALLKVRQAFRSAAVDLPPEESKAPYHSITLPETFDLDDFELPDAEIFQGDFVDHHVSSKEQITLQDTMEGVAYPTSQFGPDERFGDGDTSQIGLDLDEELLLNKSESSGHGVLASSGGDPQQSVNPSSIMDGEETREKIDDASDLIANHTIEGPATPGLLEEPYLPSPQEAQVSEDHMEEDHKSADPVAKEFSAVAPTNAETDANLSSVLLNGCNVAPKAMEVECIRDDRVSESKPHDALPVQFEGVHGEAHTVDLNGSWEPSDYSHKAATKLPEKNVVNDEFPTTSLGSRSEMEQSLDPSGMYKSVDLNRSFEPSDHTHKAAPQLPEKSGANGGIPTTLLPSRSEMDTLLAPTGISTTIGDHSREATPQHSEKSDANGGSSTTLLAGRSEMDKLSGPTGISTTIGDRFHEAAPQYTEKSDANGGFDTTFLGRGSEMDKLLAPTGISTTIGNHSHKAAPQVPERSDVKGGLPTTLLASRSEIDILSAPTGISTTIEYHSDIAAPQLPGKSDANGGPPTTSLLSRSEMDKLLAPAGISTTIEYHSDKAAPRLPGKGDAYGGFPTTSLVSQSEMGKLFAPAGISTTIEYHSDKAAPQLPGKGDANGGFPTTPLVSRSEMDKVLTSSGIFTTMGNHSHKATPQHPEQSNANGGFPTTLLTSRSQMDKLLAPTGISTTSTTTGDVWELAPSNLEQRRIVQKTQASMVGDLAIRNRGGSENAQAPEVSISDKQEVFFRSTMGGHHYPNIFPCEVACGYLNTGYNRVSNHAQTGRDHGVADSHLSSPEKMLSFLNLPVGHNSTPQKAFYPQGYQDTTMNKVSGKKRSFTESTVTMQSFNSAESFEAAQSKISVGIVPDDNDLLSSILVGRRSTAFMLKPTPPASELVSSKRPRVGSRTSAHKRKVLVDDLMVLHGDTIREQLVSTVDIRRVRKKAPSSHPEIWMLQKQALEDGIFTEPLFTGMTTELVRLHCQPFDLSRMKVIEIGGNKSDLTTTVSSESPSGTTVCEHPELGRANMPSSLARDAGYEKSPEFIPQFSIQPSLMVLEELDGHKIEKETAASISCNENSQTDRQDGRANMPSLARGAGYEKSPEFIPEFPIQPSSMVLEELDGHKIEKETAAGISCNENSQTGQVDPSLARGAGSEKSPEFIPQVPRQPSSMVLEELEGHGTGKETAAGISCNENSQTGRQDEKIEIELDKMTLHDVETNQSLMPEVHVQSSLHYGSEHNADSINDNTVRLSKEIARADEPFTGNCLMLEEQCIGVGLCEDASAAVRSSGEGHTNTGDGDFMKHRSEEGNFTVRADTDSVVAATRNLTDFALPAYDENTARALSSGFEGPEVAFKQDLNNGKSENSGMVNDGEVNYSGARYDNDGPALDYPLEGAKLDSTPLEGDLTGGNATSADGEHLKADHQIPLDSVITSGCEPGLHEPPCDFEDDDAEHDTGFLNFDDDNDDDEIAEDENPIPDAEGTDDLDNSGWSTRTRAVANYLQTLFKKEALCGRRAVCLDNLLAGKTRKEASRMFFETLVLKTRDYIEAEQQDAFGNINVKPRLKLMKSAF